jgi:hypothetical protein
MVTSGGLGGGAWSVAEDRQPLQAKVCAANRNAAQDALHRPEAKRSGAILFIRT